MTNLDKLYGFAKVTMLTDMAVTLPSDPDKTDFVVVHPNKDGVVWVRGVGMGDTAIFPGAKPVTFRCVRYGWWRAWWERLWYRPDFRWQFEE